MSRVPQALAEQVVQRAGGICEYCRISLEDTFFGGEIDHIRSLKHRGETISENLALACQPCNRNKGSDLASVATSGALVRFFDPRTDVWQEHFRALSNGVIEPITEIGEVTIAVLGFNQGERISERKGLIEIGHYDAE